MEYNEPSYFSKLFKKHLDRPCKICNRIWVVVLILGVLVSRHFTLLIIVNKFCLNLYNSRIFSYHFTSDKSGKILVWRTGIIILQTKSRLVEESWSSCGFLRRILSTRRAPEIARMPIFSCEFFAMERCLLSESTFA